MAEKKGVGHAYNVDFLNVVFAASSLFLFLSVIWMVWDDYDRDWKNTQRRFAQLEYQVTQAQLAAGGRAASTGTSSQQLEAQRDGGRRRTSRPTRQKVDELQAKLKDADNAAVPRDDSTTSTLKATYDQDRYDFEASRAPASVERRRRSSSVAEDEEQQLQRARTSRREKAEAEKAAIQKQLGQYTGEVAAAQKQIDEMNAEQNRLQQAARRHRAERGEGLLPQRAAARLHGADASRSSRSSCRTSSTT